MDRIKKIKIKQQDGTMSDYYPIGADASNVDIDYNNSTLEVTMKKTPRYYENVASMKLDDTLQEGDMAITLGYYTANDGGGAEYEIKNNLIANGYNIHVLNNNLFAELIIKNRTLSIKQIGAKGNYVLGSGDLTKDDTEYFSFVSNSNLKVNKLIIPSGKYLLTSTWNPFSGTGAFSNIREIEGTAAAWQNVSFKWNWETHELANSILIFKNDNLEEDISYFVGGSRQGGGILRHLTFLNESLNREITGLKIAGGHHTLIEKCYLINWTKYGIAFTDSGYFHRVSDTEIWTNANYNVAYPEAQIYFENSNPQTQSFTLTNVCLEGNAQTGLVLNGNGHVINSLFVTGDFEHKFILDYANFCKINTIYTEYFSKYTNKGGNIELTTHSASNILDNFYFIGGTVNISEPIPTANFITDLGKNNKITDYGGYGIDFPVIPQYSTPNMWNILFYNNNGNLGWKNNRTGFFRLNATAGYSSLVSVDSDGLGFTASGNGSLDIRFLSDTILSLAKHQIGSQNLIITWDWEASNDFDGNLKNNQCNGALPAYYKIGEKTYRAIFNVGKLINDNFYTGTGASNFVCPIAFIRNCTQGSVHFFNFGIYFKSDTMAVSTPPQISCYGGVMSGNMWITEEGRLILKDTANGNFYRLAITNGEIIVSQI